MADGRSLAVMEPATYGCEVGRVEDEPVYLRLRSARQDTAADSTDERPVIELSVMPFITWQIVKRRIKERWPCLKVVPDQNIRLLHKSVELRSGSMVDDYNIEGGTAERPAELQYLIIDQGADEKQVRRSLTQVEAKIGLYVDAQVPCTQLLRERVLACLGAMMSGIQPRLTDDGTGATYMLRNSLNSAPMAVFKPKDEEAFAPQNPRGYVGAENTPGLRQGVLSTQQAAREVAAYLLDHEKFASVPETTLAHAKHPKFSKVKGKNGSEKTVWKIGALQAFVETKDTAGNLASQVFSVADVQRIGILDIRIVNLDRNDGNMLVRHGRTSKYELVPIDHGLSLPDCLEVYADDMAWMSWPQARQPFGQRELAYIRGLNGARDARLLAKCLGIRRECLRLMEVTTRLLQIGAEHGLTLYDIGTILYRDDRGAEATVEKSKMEKVIEHSLDVSLARAGEGSAASSFSSTLAGLDLITSRHIGGPKFGRQISAGTTAGGCTSTEAWQRDIGLTPQLGPSSPISSPLSTSPGLQSLEQPPPFSLDEDESDGEDLLAQAVGLAPLPSPSGACGTGMGAASERLGADRLAGAPETPSKSTPRPFRGTSYKAGGTKLRQRTSAALSALHREGRKGNDEGGSIFARPGLSPSDWSLEMEKAFRRQVASEITDCIRKHFPGKRPQQQQPEPADSKPEFTMRVETVDKERNISLASAFGGVRPGEEEPESEPEAARAAPDRPMYVPPHMRKAAESGAGAGVEEAAAETAAAAAAATSGSEAPAAAADEDAPVLPQSSRRYIPPQERARLAAEAAAAAEEQGKAPEAPKRKYIPPQLRKAMAEAEAIAEEPEASADLGGQQDAPTASAPSSPALPTHESAGNDRFGYCVHQGPRASMEDAVDAVEQLGGDSAVEFYAVYDGHSGTQAVKYVKRQLPLAICSRTDFESKDSIEKALHDAITTTDDELLKVLALARPKLKPEDASKQCSYVLSPGCVGCVVLVKNSTLHIANLGDCRAVLCNGGEMVPLTVDHRPEVNEEERQRLQALGIEVSSDGYVHGRIGVSRAFGDWVWDAEEKCRGLICLPDLTEAQITEESEFLLMGCDGIFEKITSKEAGQVVRRRLRATAGDAKAAAEALVKMAEKSNGSDNLSAIVVLFKKPEVPADSGRTAPRLFGRRASAPPAAAPAAEEEGSAASAAATPTE